MFRFKLMSLGALVGVCFLSSSLKADDAGVLPEGVWRVQMISAFSFIEDRFDSTGTSTSLGSDYSQTISTPFLAALKPQVSELMKTMKAVNPSINENLDIANIGMDIESVVYSNRFALEYGLTKRLSVGIILPIVYADVSVNATSEATEEFEATLAAAPDALKPALMAMRAQTSLEAIDQSLRSDLGYSAGLDKWSGTGIGDLELGAKYNYYRSHPFMMTLKGGLRVPTGRTDDPDHLFDMAFGDGQFDLGFFHYTDYRIRKNLDLTWEAGYTAQLPHSSTYRIPVIDGVDISPIREELDRDPGDIVETGLELAYDPFRTMLTSVKYRFRHKFEDSFSGGSSGINLSSLETDTDQQIHEAIFRVGFTTIPLVRAKEMRLPMELSMFYRYPFAGQNNAAVQTAGLQLKSYF
jgi:hypothetical protein